MGINNLLQILKPITYKTHISNYEGQKIGIVSIFKLLKKYK
jgi:hypothetical protein